MARRLPHEFRRGAFALTGQEDASILRRAIPGLAPLRADGGLCRFRHGHIVTESLARMSATRLVVAHRLSTVRDADQIAVVDAGRIIELGSHDELMALGGHYRDLVERQL